MRGGTESPKSHRSRIPNLQDLMPDDLRWNSHKNNNIICTVDVTSLNHPETISPPWFLEKLSFTKLILVSNRLGVAVIDNQGRCYY